MQYLKPVKLLEYDISEFLISEGLGVLIWMRSKLGCMEHCSTRLGEETQRRLCATDDSDYFMAVSF